MTKANSTQADKPEEWSSPKPDTLAEPTWWPAALSFGATLLAWGIVTSFIIALIGLAVFVISLIGWIHDIRHEQAHAAAEHQVQPHPEKTHE